MIAAMAAACMMFGTCTTAFAAESTSWKDYDYSSYLSSWSGSSGSTISGSSSGWSWGSGSGWSWGGTNSSDSGNEEAAEEDNSLEAPEISECRYIHQSINAPDCLVVDWSDVDGAASYEMEMCDSNYNVIQVYSLDRSRYSAAANRTDENVTGCYRGRKIRVRAIDEEGNAGKWSEYSTVSCNSLNR